jgi:hypothetical protein
MVSRNILAFVMGPPRAAAFRKPLPISIIIAPIAARLYQFGKFLGEEL